MLDWLIFGLFLVMLLINALNLYLWLTRPKPPRPPLESEMVREDLGRLVGAGIITASAAAELLHRYMERKEEARRLGAGLDSR